MKMRRTLLAIAALATMATAAFTPAPAQADDTTTTIELKQKDVTLGEVHKVVAAVTKEKLDAPKAISVFSDNGKGAPSGKQLESLLAGKSVDDITHFKTTEKISTDLRIRDILEGTPLPAVVGYRVNRLVISIVCAGDRCTVIVTDHRRL